MRYTYTLTFSVVAEFVDSASAAASVYPHASAGRYSRIRSSSDIHPLDPQLGTGVAAYRIGPNSIRLTTGHGCEYTLQDLGVPRPTPHQHDAMKELIADLSCVDPTVQWESPFEGFAVLDKPAGTHGVRTLVCASLNPVEGGGRIPIGKYTFRVDALRAAGILTAGLGTGFKSRVAPGMQQAVANMCKSVIQVRKFVRNSLFNPPTA